MSARGYDEAIEEIRARGYDEAIEEIRARYDKKRNKIYRGEEDNKNAALVFVLVALLSPFFCWFFDMIFG